MASSPSLLKKSRRIWPEPNRKTRTRCSWTDEEELRLLGAVLEIVSADSDSPSEYASLFDPIQRSLGRDFTREQVVDKLRALKRNFQNPCSSDADAGSHDRKLFEICQKIWGDPRTRTQKMEMEEREMSNPGDVSTDHS